MRSIRLLAENDYDFSSLASGCSIAVPLHQRLRVTSFVCANVALRLHAANIPAGAIVRIALQEAAPTTADPAQFFRGRTLGSAGLVGTQAAPVLALGYAALTAAHVAVFLVVTQAPTATALTFTISADLVLHDAPRTTVLDLSIGGSFARALEGAYYRRGPTDGTTAFLAWAASGVRRVEDRGDWVGPGLLMEKASTNALTAPRDITDSAGWPEAASGSTITAGQPNSPDGTSNATRCECPTSGTYSRWIQSLMEPGRYSQFAKTRNGGPYAAQMGGTAPSVFAAPIVWRRDDADASPQNGMFTPAWYGVFGPGAPVDVDIDLAQYEVGTTYPTSPIETSGGTRPADTLSYASGDFPEALLGDGLVIAFAPDASSAELVAAGEDWRLVQNGTSDYVRLRQSGSDCLVELVCGGSVVASRGVTFSRGQPLTLIAKPSAGTLTVSGATTGNGASAGTGAVWSASQTLYIGGDNGGANNVTGRYLPPPGSLQPTPGIAVAR